MLNNNKKQETQFFGTKCGNANSIAAGYATETTNYGEIATGILNKSTKGDNPNSPEGVVGDPKATLFSVGCGTKEERKNALEVKGDGSVIISGKDGSDVNIADLAEKLDQPSVDLSEYVNKNELAATESAIQKQIATKANAQDVTNAIGELQDKIDDIPTADEEDITAEGDTPQTQVLKLKDRAYDSLNASGKGYKILRKNWQQINGERKNVLTQEMINEPNTIYEIRYDFDLNGATITIQNNCLLRFSGGTLNNGTIVGENTAIAANKDSIFNGITLNGTFNIEKLYAEWFGVIPDVETDNSSNINKAIDNAVNINRELFFIKNTYYIHNPIILKNKLVISGNTGVETTTKIIYTGTKNCCEVYNDKHITIRNISFVKDGYDKLTIDEIDSNIIGIYFHNGIYRLTLDNCSFYGFGYALTGEGSKGSGMSYNNILNCQFRKCIIAIYFKGFSDPNVVSLVSYCTYTNIENCIFSGMKRGAIYISVHSDLDIVNISQCNIEFIGYRNYFSVNEQTLFGIYLKSVLPMKSRVNISDCYMENIYHYDTENKIENANYSDNYAIGVENISVSVRNVNNINCINFLKSFGVDFIDIYNGSFNGNLIDERNIICIPNVNTCLFVNTFTSTTDNFDIINCNIINKQGELSLKSIMLNSIQAPHYAACFINIGNQTKTYDSLLLYINSENENCETNSGLLHHRPMNLESFRIPINSLTLFITGVFNINGQKISNVGHLVLDSGIISIENRLGLYSVDSVKVKNTTIRSVGNNAFIKLFKSNQNKVTDISFIKNSFEGDNDIILFEGEDSGIMTSAYANIFIERANKTSGIKVFAYNNENKVPVSIYGNNILEDNTILYTGIASFGSPMVSLEGQSYIDKNKLLPSWQVNKKKIAADGYNINYNRKGTTIKRPTVTPDDAGFQYYDTDLKKYIVWNGTEWVNMDGSSLGEQPTQDENR